MEKPVKVDVFLLVSSFKGDGKRGKSQEKSKSGRMTE